MKVSIIIPVYNKEKYLRKCLQSLAMQSEKDLEIIVVDDGSKEISNIKYRISKIKTKFKDIQLLIQEHRGAGAARNLGARKAKGKILVFVDSDMTFDKNFVKNLIQPVMAGKAKGTFSREEYVANWQNIWSRCWNYNLGLGNKRKIPRDYSSQAPVFRAILKSEFLKAGGFELVGYADDWTLAQKLGYEAYAAADAVYFHYNPGSLREVFIQAKWRVKRRYKGGFWGDLLNLAKFSFPVSLFIGFFKFVQFCQPRFLIFKIVFDFGSFLGLLEKILLKNYY